jgi:hypothetical protein
MSLSSLPVELLAEINAYLDIYSLCYLYSTGNSLLCTKLAKKGVSYIHIEHVIDADSILGVFKLAQVLSPSSLRLVLPNCALLDYSGFRLLGYLPPSLISLHLSGYDVEAYFTQFEDIDHEIANSVHNFKVYYETRVVTLESDADSRPYTESMKKLGFFHFNLAAQLPCLQTLILDFEVPDKDGNSPENVIIPYLDHPSNIIQARMPPQCIQFFPSSLTALSMDGAQSFTSNYLKQLPRSLTSMKFTPLCGFRASYIEDLPPNLAELILPAVVLFQEEILPKLPQSLARVKCSGSSLIATTSMLTELPRNLIDLHIRTQAGPPIINVLPDTLTRLVIQLSWANEKEVVRVPANLKELKILFWREFTGRTLFKFLPPHLEVLTMEGISHLDASTIELLPRSLKELRIDGTSFFLSKILRISDKLPPRLEMLRIASWLNDDLPFYINETQFKMLPKTIRNLEMSVALEDKLIDFLPPKINRLVLNQLELDAPESISRLPKSLRQLCLHEKPKNKEHWTIETLGFLPPFTDLEGPEFYNDLWEEFHAEFENQYEEEEEVDEETSKKRLAEEMEREVPDLDETMLEAPPAKRPNKNE